MDYSLETQRLILRPWMDQDLPAFARLNADPRVMEFFPRLLSPEESRTLMTAFQTKLQEGGICFLAAELKETGEFVGTMGLNRPDYQLPFTPCVEIGWRVAFEHWNKGYATEGALALLRFGFEALRLHRIASFTTTANLRSQRIMEKIGMERDLAGDFDHPKLPEGHPLRRHVLYWISNPA